MILNPGEAAVLIVRRSKTEPQKYFFAVRTSMNSTFDTGKDFEIGSPQRAVKELQERADVDQALHEAFEAIKNLNS